MDSRINRNILECKVIRMFWQNHQMPRINRNILECKAVKSYIFLDVLVVLIETYWNVKIFFLLYLFSQSKY